MNIQQYPNIETKKDYMEYLGSLMTAAEEEAVHDRGRPRQLKTILIESNSEIPSEFSTGRASVSIKETDVQDIRRVQVTIDNHKVVPFFLDTSDKRFWILHTNALSDVVAKATNMLIGSDKYEFDRTWFASSMLQDIASMQGNRSMGFKLNYQDLFLKEELDTPVEEFQISINGTSSDRALAAIQKEQALQNTLAFSRVRILRGSRPRFSRDDFTFSGQFVVKGGTSIDDHVSLVETARKTYAGKMKEIENFGIGVKTVDDRTLVEGKAFDFEFKRNIEDVNAFVEGVFSSKFRLWGLKSKLTEETYRILAVDLHTGDPFDLEISKNLMRVYLPKGSCGNVVLRLLVNLQHYFDSNIKCDEIGLYGAHV